MTAHISATLRQRGEMFLDTDLSGDGSGADI
jgi:hypothetical protein